MTVSEAYTGGLHSHFVNPLAAVEAGLVRPDACGATNTHGGLAQQDGRFGSVISDSARHARDNPDVAGCSEA